MVWCKAREVRMMDDVCTWERRRDSAGGPSWSFYLPKWPRGQEKLVLCGSPGPRSRGRAAELPCKAQPAACVNRWGLQDLKYSVHWYST